MYTNTISTFSLSEDSSDRRAFWVLLLSKHFHGCIKIVLFELPIQDIFRFLGWFSVTYARAQFSYRHASCGRKIDETWRTVISFYMYSIPFFCVTLDLQSLHKCVPLVSVNSSGVTLAIVGSICWTHLGQDRCTVHSRCCIQLWRCPEQTNRRWIWT